MSPPATVAPWRADPAPLPSSLVGLLAAGAGLAVASIYYSQPLLGPLGVSLHASPAEVGAVPTLTQLGYALGIVLLAPLGDRHDRRHLIVLKAAMLVLALLGCALAPNLGVLMLASLAVGVAATMAQDIVPAAATLASAAQRGRTVGTVMTGLLLGILLSRVVSGVLAQPLGWRAVYGLAALAVALIGWACWRGLPRFAPTTSLPYGELLASMVGLWRRHPELRRAAWAQGLLSVAFSAFWSTLALMLFQRYQMGSAVAGAFGLAGAAGALAAPLAGRWADRRGAAWVTRLGCAVAVLCFAALALESHWPLAARLPWLALCTVGFDFGVQAALVAHQTLVYSLEPAARSRLNALLLTAMFIGMAAGSALGSLVLAHWGWWGVVGLSTLMAGGALLVRLLDRPVAPA
ncbi:MFS transporter [Curvibacter sp. HBC61]|uniref:MFS transporter n=1 Tax=Curvibacter cyanobacteriorum TaxID=3026422 RepID=A0ABT5N463_9BURK|nr:MFS transporter [Curvibacter sp. HBC61]MDD0839872.1 MFS transporter [Curvibacter sp. HBC61]